MEKISSLEQEIQQCERCHLRKDCIGVTTWNGSPGSPLMIVGEGPGEVEDQYGVPLVGPSGKLLDKALKAVGIARHLVFTTNVIKCRPLRNRTPNEEEACFCAHNWLEKEISIIKPKVILALGSVALRYLYSEKFSKVSIIKTRGNWFTSSHGIEIMPTFHPAYILRQTGENLKKTKWQVFYDFQAAKKRCEELAADYSFIDNTWPEMLDIYAQRKVERLSNRKD